jgi:PAS domain S-box-containing protein
VSLGAYERVLEDVPGLTFTYAADGTTQFVSRRLLDYMGRSFEELQTWAFNDTMHPDDFDRVTREWRANIAAGQAYVMEHRMRRADGVYRWVRVNVAPRHDVDGQLAGWCGIVVDIDDATRVSG